MNNITKFPDMKGSMTEVYCEPLGISFPRIYRLQAADRIVYSLMQHNPHEKGPVTVSQVRTIALGDLCSVLVRWHRSIDAAEGYVTTLRDNDVEPGTNPICQTDQGYFTLIERLTRSEWPSPMIFYIAEASPLSPLGHARYWERSVSVTERWYDAGLLGIGLDRT